jgi:hypothetical protein
MAGLLVFPYLIARVVFIYLLVVFVILKKRRETKITQAGIAWAIPQ